MVSQLRRRQNHSLLPGDDGLRPADGRMLSSLSAMHSAVSAPVAAPGWLLFISQAFTAVIGIVQLGRRPSSCCRSSGFACNNEQQTRNIAKGQSLLPYTSDAIRSSARRSSLAAFAAVEIGGESGCRRCTRSSIRGMERSSILAIFSYTCRTNALL